MGAAGEGQNTAHQQKKLILDALKEMRDRFNIPVSDKDIDSVPLLQAGGGQYRKFEYLHGTS